MADSNLQGLTEDSTPGDDSILYTVDDPAGTPVDRKVTKANLLSGLQAEPSEGAFADGDKTKLDGIETGAQVNVAPEGTAILSTGEIGGNKFLREDGDGTSSWQTVPGGGDMLASTYDTDADGRVDAAETVTLEVQNETGATITEGSVVYISGWNIPNTLPEITDARSDSASTMPAIGIVNADITTGNSGYITTNGLIEGQDTSAFTTGDSLYVDPTTAGTVTTTKPAGANLIQKIGTVGRSNISNGTILVSGANRSNDVPNFTAADKFWYGGTSGVSAEGDITAAGRAILDDADASAQRTTLGLAIGSDVQAYDANNATSSSTNTFTNKTFDANAAGNSLSNVDVADLANGTDGELITWDAAGAPATVAVGTSGHVLTSNGAGAAPTFQAAAGGGGSNPYGAEIVVAASGGDYTTVMDALAAASAGDVIYVEPGTYSETPATVSTADLTVIGHSKEDTIMQFSSTSHTSITGTNITFQNIEIRMTNTGRFQPSGNYFTMRDCIFNITSATMTLGFNLTGQYMKIINNEFYTTSDDDRQLEFGPQQGIITGNFFYLAQSSDTAGDGPVRVDAQNSTFSDNTVVCGATGTADYPMISFALNESAVTANTIEMVSTTTGGARFNSNNRTTVSGNSFKGGSMGVDWASGSDSVLTGNTILTYGGTGINLDVSECLVSNNALYTYTGSTGIGIQVVAGTDKCMILGNSATNYDTGYDIADATCDGNVLANNLALGNTTAIDDNGTSTVTSNNITV